MYGVGLVAVNALSSWLNLDVFRDGRRYSQRYERGIPCNALQDVEATAKTGTRITFLPDAAIFSDTWINPGDIAARLRELSCLVPPLKLSFHDRRTHRYHEPLGVRAFLDRTRGPQEPASGVVLVHGFIDQIAVEGAMEWRGHRWSSIESYANIHRTTDGGTHVQGLLNGLVMGLRDAARDRVKGCRKPYLLRAVEQGLHAVVCVRLRDPHYDSPTKSRLSSPEVGNAVCTAVSQSVVLHLRSDTALLDRLVTSVDRKSR